jgi:anaerobic C4-dicarboxylate transporter
MLMNNANTVSILSGLVLLGFDLSPAALVAPFSATVHIFFVIENAGNEFRAIETDAGAVITRIALRQFPEGDWRQ